MIDCNSKLSSISWVSLFHKLGRKLSRSSKLTLGSNFWKVCVLGASSWKSKRPLERVVTGDEQTETALQLREMTC